MARPLRIEYEGAWYHVMNRGAGRRRIYGSDTERRLFLHLLGELDETFGVAIHAYCLMANHYHLLLQTPRANLSLAMRHLSGVYTQRINRLEETDGALFRGRFKAILIDADSYLAQLSRYIHLNPVEAGVVNHPASYRWSSYRAYVGRVESPSWLTREATLALFGKRDARRRYQTFVGAGVDDELQAFYKRSRLDPVLGTERFRRQVARRLRPVRRAREVPDVRRLVRPPTIEQIIRVTADVFDVRTTEVRRKLRARGQRNVARLVGIALSRRLGGYSLQAIADAFAVSHYASVSAAVRRLTDLIAADRALARKVAQIERNLGDWKRVKGKT